MDTIEAIKTRRTIRQYAGKAVAKEILSDLVDCARLAPTAMNDQPWEFVVVTSEETRKKVYSLITHAQQIVAAPACIAVLCKPTKYYVEDGSAAVMNILTAAHARNLGACWVSADKQPYADDVRKLLGAPAAFKLHTIVTIGFPAESPAVEKRALEKVIHWEQF